jgi:hypothetical protein
LWTVIFYVSDVFLVAYLQAAAGLAHVQQVAGVAHQLINSPLVGLKLVVIGWFGEPYYGVVASEGGFYVSMFEQVGDPTYVWGGKGEGCRLCVIFGVCEGSCVYYFVLHLMF